MNRPIVKFVLAIVSPVMFGWLADVSSAQITQGPASGLWNTGVDSSGVPLANGTVGDPHYAARFGSWYEQHVARHCNDAQLPGRAWWRLGESARRHPTVGLDRPGYWLYRVLQDPSIGGNYDYQTTFNLFAAGPVLITGQWSADNHGVDILLDGASTGNFTEAPGYPLNQYPGTDPSYDFEQWTPFTITGTGTRGTNTLDFLTYNSTVSPVLTGLRVEFTSSVPEPSTLVLLGVGAIGLLGLAWRKRRHS